jgi:hypothetical protein
MKTGLSRWDMQHVAAVTLCASVFITVTTLPAAPDNQKCARDEGHLCRGEVKSIKSENTKPARTAFWA